MLLLVLVVESRPSFVVPISRPVRKLFGVEGVVVVRPFKEENTRLALKLTYLKFACTVRSKVVDIYKTFIFT